MSADSPAMPDPIHENSSSHPCKDEHFGGFLGCSFSNRKSAMSSKVTARKLHLPITPRIHLLNSSRRSQEMGRGKGNVTGPFNGTGNPFCRRERERAGQEECSKGDHRKDHKTCSYTYLIQ